MVFNRLPERIEVTGLSGFIGDRFNFFGNSLCLFLLLFILLCIHAVRSK